MMVLSSCAFLNMPYGSYIAIAFIQIALNIQEIELQVHSKGKDEKRDEIKDAWLVYTTTAITTASQQSSFAESLFALLFNLRHEQQIQGFPSYRSSCSNGGLDLECIDDANGKRTAKLYY